MHFKYGEPEKVNRAKQRASVAWIIQKAHKNKVPLEFQEPYYKDYEGQEHLKPNIVHRLANADFYCSALANIYGDPNFHNLSHWNIIQSLARKGVYVAEPTDIALTETVLIQTTPLKMSAHLAVIEAMMALYIREVVVAERVVQSVRRMCGPDHEFGTPQDHEEALVVWIDSATQTLQLRIQQQLDSNNDEQLPVFPKIQEISDLIDGIGLAALIAFYCPMDLPWEDIAVADPPSMADSLYNIGLVIRFCQESLPYNPCLLTKEDIVYMHSSVKQNILGFIAELFFLLELEPVSCVTMAATKKISTKYIQLSSPGIKPAGVASVRRSQSMNMKDANEKPHVEHKPENTYISDMGGRDSSMSDCQDEFVVKRAKGYSTLSAMMRNTSPQRSDSRALAKERYNFDTKDEEMGETISRRGNAHEQHASILAAGLPSRMEDRPHGRSRSRRNSINADESQLTIENFGGSQDNLNYIGRNPDKDPYIHSGKKSWNPENIRQSRERSMERKIQDLYKPSMEEFDAGYMDKMEKEAIEKEKDERYIDHEMMNTIKHEYAESSTGSDMSGDPDKKSTNFAEISKIKEQLPRGINIIYMQPDKADKLKQEKKPGHAPITTWKQQVAQNHEEDNKIDVNNMEPQVMSSELHNVRLKLEEKRRHIEAEKRKVEMMMNKQRQKLGKEAFMQAVVKGDLGTEVTNMSKKWLENSQPEELHTPDIDAMDYNDCQNSISQPMYYKGDMSRRLSDSRLVQPRRYSLYDPGNWRDADRSYRRSSSQYVPYRMTDSLTEIQSDIQMLTQQQNQIQSMMQNGMQATSMPPHQNQFYLHDQQGNYQQNSPSRKVWGQPPPDQNYSSMSAINRRPQWGPPSRPIVHQDYMMGMQQNAPYYQYPPKPIVQQLPPLNPMMQPHNQSGFVLHNQHHSLPPGHQQMYQNGQGYYNPEQQYRAYQQGYNEPPRMPVQNNNTPFRLHDGPPNEAKSQPQSQAPPPIPPKPQKSPTPPRQTHAPVAAPSPDDMEPQKVGFIDSDKNETNITDKLKRMSITSGSRTYRISDQGSPTRPTISTKMYRVPTKKGIPVNDDLDLPRPPVKERSLSPQQQHEPEEDLGIVAEPLQDGPKAEQGFYISFDEDVGPKRPKPQLRPRRMSQKKPSIPGREEPPPVPERTKRGIKTPASLTSPSTSSPLTSYSRSNSSKNEHFPLSPISSRTDIRSLNSSRSDVPSLSSRSNLHSFLNSRTDVPSMSSRSDIPSMSSRSDIPSMAARSNITPSSSGGSIKYRGDRTPNAFINENKFNFSRFYDKDTDDSESTIEDAKGNSGVALVIGDQMDEDNAFNEMERKKEKLMIASMKRKQKQEELKRQKELEAEEKREEEKLKMEEKQRKKDEEKARRELILEKHKIKKAIEEAEKEGRYYNPPSWYYEDSSGTTTPKNKGSVRLRHTKASKPRPKTMHESSFSEVDSGKRKSQSQRGSSHNITESNDNTPSYLRKGSKRWGSSSSLSRATGARGSTGSLRQDSVNNSFSRSVDKGHSGRRPQSVIGSSMKSKSAYGSRNGGLNNEYEVHEARRPSLLDRQRARTRPTRYAENRKYRSTGNLYGDQDSLLYHMSEDSGLGRSTPPRRAASPGMSSRHFPSPSGPGSLPPGLVTRRRPGAFDDNASDISATSSNMDYSGPRLFKQPTSKSNRTIILNAIEYCVFPGVVNQNNRQRVLNEIARAESKHFLILFRDTGFQFRGIYSYNPETEEVIKIYGTGPKQVSDRMFDQFFKYNSGGRCFTQIHTKHLTVTIDAFTIHNSLWQGKRIHLPSKKDMKLVI